MNLNHTPRGGLYGSVAASGAASGARGAEGPHGASGGHTGDLDHRWVARDTETDRLHCANCPLTWADYEQHPRGSRPACRRCACQPTRTEPHPRLPITRCANCKEHLDAVPRTTA